MAIDFPAAPAVGQQFVGGNTTYQWDGTGWNIVPQMGPMSMSDTPPPNPAIGQQWWRTSNGQLYVWYDDGSSAQWVQAAGSVATPGWEPIVINDFAGQTSIVKTDLSAFKTLKLHVDAYPDTVAGTASVQYSTNNGSSWVSGAADYTGAGLYWRSSTPSAAGASRIDGSTGALFFGNTIAIGRSGDCDLVLGQWNKNKETLAKGVMSWISVAPELLVAHYTIQCIQALAFNALRLNFSTAFSGRMILEGMRG